MILIQNMSNRGRGRDSYVSVQHVNRDGEPSRMTVIQGTRPWRLIFETCNARHFHLFLQRMAKNAHNLDSSLAKDFHRYHRARCATAPAASGYYETFSTAESPFRANLKHIEAGLGHEAPFRNSRGRVQRAGESSLGDNLVTRLPDEWRSCTRYIDPGSGSHSERVFRPSKKKLSGPADNSEAPWKSSLHAVDHVDESATDAHSKWKSSRHRPSIFTEWYLDDHVQSEWKSSKRPGVYTHQAEWVPPFREYEGKVPKRFYSIIAAGAADARRKSMSGKRKSTRYNQFATTFDKDLHYDEFKKPLGGIKTRYKNDHQWPFNPLPPPRCKKRFYTHICHHEGVSTLMNHTRDYDYNSYVFL